MIDLRRLQVLRAVHAHGTVTAAARALHLTPSAVSHHLRELGREMRLVLTEPQGRRIRLTPAALLLVEHSDALLARWEETKAAVESYRSGEAGLLRVCGFPTAVAGLLAPACVVLRREYPQVRVQISEVEVPECFDQLLTESVDLALVAPTEEGPYPGDPRFDRFPVLREPLDLLVPAAHRFAEADAVHLADAAEEDWVLPAPGTCEHHQRVRVTCAAVGFTPRVAHFAVDWAAVGALVGHGLGVSLVPRLVEVPGPVARVPLSGEVPCRQVVGVVRRGSLDHPLVQRAIGALEQVVAAFRAAD